MILLKLWSIILCKLSCVTLCWLCYVNACFARYFDCDVIMKYNLILFQSEPKLNIYFGSLPKRTVIMYLRPPTNMIVTHNRYCIPRHYNKQCILVRYSRNLFISWIFFWIASVIYLPDVLWMNLLGCACLVSNEIRIPFVIICLLTNGTSCLCFWCTFLSEYYR